MFINSPGFLFNFIAKEVLLMHPKLIFVDYFLWSILGAQGSRLTQYRVFIKKSFGYYYVGMAHCILNNILCAHGFQETVEENTGNLLQDIKIFGITNLNENIELKKSLGSIFNIGNFLGMNMFYLSDVIDITKFFSYKHNLSSFFVTSFFPACFFSYKFYQNLHLAPLIDFTKRYFKYFNLNLIFFGIDNTNHFYFLTC